MTQFDLQNKTACLEMTKIIRTFLLSFIYCHLGAIFKIKILNRFPWRKNFYDLAKEKFESMSYTVKQLSRKCWLKQSTGNYWWVTCLHNTGQSTFHINLLSEEFGLQLIIDYIEGFLNLGCRACLFSLCSITHSDGINSLRKLNNSHRLQW